MNVRINREEPTAAQRRALKIQVKQDFEKLLQRPEFKKYMR